LKKYTIHTHSIHYIADTVTPVALYLKLRDKFPGTLMLESADYHAVDNSYSYIAIDPIASFTCYGKKVEICEPDGSIYPKPITASKNLLQELRSFMNIFDMQEEVESKIARAFFGYISYDAVPHFEDIQLKTTEQSRTIPVAIYKLFRFVIAINHFKDEMYLYENSIVGQQNSEITSNAIEAIIRNKNIPKYPFKLNGTEHANCSDEYFLKILKQGQWHCFRGDVFQIVLSRRYSQSFTGDDLNVYRALRSINPSPYLFYFDFGYFRLFGSSPEAQLVINDNEATIFPIAGTFKRTGNDAADKALAQQLFDDPKENAEHVMLVDLARNDLNRSCTNVFVEKFKEIQFYSHVIHLVSKVKGMLNPGTDKLQLIADTFPAGTLSGAPKYKAMQIIDALEADSRGFYAGCVGVLHADGDFNHAIMIRSFLSKDNMLHYQAGAGVVAKSKPESELQEVHNKLGALRHAMVKAEKI
jgi:anthranilate synthase component 1